MSIKLSKSCLINMTLLWLPLFAVAQQRTYSDAESIAQRFWKSHLKTDVSSKGVVKSSLVDIDGTSCYVVTRTEEFRQDTLSGFMLIAKDSNLPPVLAYDAESKFSTKDLPDHIREWIRDYSNMGEQDNNGLQAWLAASESSYDDVPPLLGSREWGQDNPYNLYCPIIEGQYCPSGCVATALSQIMCYHQWPQTGTGSIDYCTTTNKIDIHYDFGSTTFEWDKMMDTYTPVEDVASEDDDIVTDNKYYLSAIGVDGNSSSSSACYISISGLTVMGTSVFEGETVLLITDDNGSFVSRAASSVSVVSRGSGTVLSSKSFLLHIPSSLPDGTYRIYNAVRSTGTVQWSLANIKVGGNDNFVSFQKTGNAFFIAGNSYPCSLSLEDVHPVAALLQAVGAAVKMNYAIGGSGSNDANALEGLTSYLKYDQDMFFASPDAFTDKQWHAMLQKELAERRPVYYTGQGISSGHAFVIDGFQKAEDGTTYYHVNWGWDGLGNGYYLLNMLRPSSTGTGGSSGSNYSNKPSMLIGMKPEDGISQMSMTCGGIEVLRHEFFPGNFFPVCITRLSLLTGRDFTGTLQLILRNEKGEDLTLYETSCSVTSKRGLSDFYISCQMPTDIAGGEYELRLSCLAENGDVVDIETEDWPYIRIMDKEEWRGGSMTQSLQALAIGGDIELLVSAEDGLLTLTVDSIVNPLPQYTSGQLALVVCDEDGRMLAEPDRHYSISLSGYSVRRNASVSSHISRHIPNGSYSLCIGYLPDNHSLWTYCDQIRCDNYIWWADFVPYAIPMTMDEGFFMLSDLAWGEGADIPWVTGITDIRTGASLPHSVFNMAGHKVSARRPGIYIVKKGAKIIKTKF